MLIQRRGLIAGLAAVLAAPAIVRAENLMPIKGERYFFWDYTCPILPDPWWFGGLGAERRQDLIDECFGPNGGLYIGTWTFFGKERNIYACGDPVSFRKHESSPATPRSVLVGLT